MKNKKVVIFATTALMTIGLVAVATSSKTLFSHVTAEECEHVGNHYAAKAPTCSEAGNVEFWACCNCVQQFTVNPGGTWTDKTLTEALPTTHVAYLAPTGEHVFDQNGQCTTDGCEASFAAANELNAATSADLAPELTLSSFGVAEGNLPTDGSHAYGRYDYSKLDSFDLYFKYNPTAGNISKDVYFLIYLFNGSSTGNLNEDGIVFRIGCGRAENDGIQYCYVYSMNAYSGDVVQGAGNAGTEFFMPRASGLKAEQDNFIHISATRTDAATNSYALQLTAGVVGGTATNFTTNPEDKTNTAKVFNVTLGADYFNGTQLHRMFRMTYINGGNGADVAISNYTPSANRDVVYVGENGQAIAKRSFPSDYVVTVPTVTKAGQQFIGWYTQDGVRLENTLPAGKYVVTPKFVTLASDQSHSLSDSKDWRYLIKTVGNGWHDAKNDSVGDRACELTENYDTTNTTRLDLYFLMRYDIETCDSYVIFGFPYDFIDGETRAYIRLDLRGSTVNGYMYGVKAGLDNAGATGTRFNFTNVALNGTTCYLVHFSMVATDAANGLYKLGVEVTSIATGESNAYYRNATMNSDYSLGNNLRNRFSVQKGNINGSANAYIGLPW